MTAEEKCNRCEQFGPNGLTKYPCKRIPSRNCPFFLKISEKKFKKICNERIRKTKENEELKHKLEEEGVKTNPVEEIQQIIIK